MKICLAQTESIKGDIRKNIERHVRIIERARRWNADMLFFPELSITGYEPELANDLATTVENDLFIPFQETADNHGITIGIGMPTKSIAGAHISMLIFQPKKERVVYSKQFLHDDELPFFVAGNGQVYLKTNDHKIAIGICYEALQQKHFLNAHRNGMDMYIASAAKSESGVAKAYVHLPKMAQEYNTPVLMVNCVGYCDNFMSAGQTAVWNGKGELLGKLDSKNQGILVYDTQLETTAISQVKIEKAQVADADQLFQIYRAGKAELERNGVYQWTDNYPTRAIVEDDVRKGVLYTLTDRGEIIGAINISEEQEAVYASVDWKFDASKVLVIHRLVIDPQYQKSGYGNLLMDFAEDYATENGYSSIRLDAYSRNERVLEFYRKRNYMIRGDVRFPEREYAFHCMEKEVAGAHDSTV